MLDSLIHPPFTRNQMHFHETRTPTSSEHKDNIDVRMAVAPSHPLSLQDHPAPLSFTLLHRVMHGLKQVECGECSRATRIKHATVHLGSCSFLPFCVGAFQLEKKVIASSDPLWEEFGQKDKIGSLG